MSLQYESDGDVVGIRHFGVKELLHKELKESVDHKLAYANMLKVEEVKMLIGNNYVAESPGNIRKKYISQLKALQDHFNMPEDVRNDKAEFDKQIDQMDAWYQQVTNAWPLKTVMIEYKNTSKKPPIARRKRARGS